MENFFKNNIYSDKNLPHFVFIKRKVYIMKNFKYLILFMTLLIGGLIFFVYTWDIPAPKQKIVKDININEKVLK